MVIRSNPPSGLKRRGDAAAGEGVNAAIIKAGERGISKVICCRSPLVHLLSWLLKFCWRSFSLFTPRQRGNEPFVTILELRFLKKRGPCGNICCHHYMMFNPQEQKLNQLRTENTHRVTRIRTLKSTTVPRWTIKIHANSVNNCKMVSSPCTFSSTQIDWNVVTCGMNEVALEKTGVIHKVCEDDWTRRGCTRVGQATTLRGTCSNKRDTSARGEEQCTEWK